MPPGAPMGPMGMGLSARHGARTSILDLDYSAKVHVHVLRTLVLFCHLCSGRKECDENGRGWGYCVSGDRWCAVGVALHLSACQSATEGAEAPPVISLACAPCVHREFLVALFNPMHSTPPPCSNAVSVALRFLGARLRPQGWKWASKDPDSQVGNCLVGVYLACVRSR